MAKKQSDYLANLLSDTDFDPVEPVQEVAPAASVVSAQSADKAVSRTGISLLGRENALARMASGEVRQITQLLLDPARVRVWSGNARLQSKLSEESCLELIESIRAEGGQRVPVIVRHINDDPDHDYELIAGTRRHYAITWLRAHSYPELKLLAQVADVDDEAAFRLADLENRARSDISDIERARNYAWALSRHYEGKAIRMSERLGVSKGWMSKMLKAATLPDEVINAFASPSELSLNPAYKLSLVMDDTQRSADIVAEALAISQENMALINSGEPALAGPAVLRRLMAGKSRGDSTASVAPLAIDGDHGRPIVSLRSVNRQGITLHVPFASGANEESVLTGIRQILENLRERGVSLN